MKQAVIFPLIAFVVATAATTAVLVKTHHPAVAGVAD